MVTAVMNDNQATIFQLAAQIREHYEYFLRCRRARRAGQAEADLHEQYSAQRLVEQANELIGLLHHEAVDVRQEAHLALRDIFMVVLPPHFQVWREEVRMRVRVLPK